MENSIFFIGVWLVCGAATVGAATSAHRSRWARTLRTSPG